MGVGVSRRRIQPASERGHLVKTMKWRGAVAALAVLSLAIAGCQDTGTTESVEDLPSISTESMDMESMDMESSTESMGTESEEASPSDDS
jgi:hypothetical protein